MTEQEIERCLERLATCKATDVMNFDYAGTLAYIKRLKAENASLINEADENAALSMENKQRADRLEAENAGLRERIEKAVELPFIVIDKKTGKEADEYEIALHEDWAKHLMYCDMEGFAIEQDGTLVLIDECGQLAYCPSDRFEICTEARLTELKGGENE